MSDSPSREDFGFLIGPLKRSQPDKLANRMFCLLSCIGINCADVNMISMDTQNGIATVHLSSAAVEDYAIKAFKEKRAVMNLFDLRLLTDKPQQLKVDRIRSRRVAEQEVAEDDRHPTQKTSQISEKPSTDTQGPQKQSRVSITKEDDVQGKQPAENRDRMEHVHDCVSLSQSSSTASSPVGFEILEEENIDDYLEGYDLPIKSKPKTRSMQTSQESSSSCGADYSSQSELCDASADSSRTSAEANDTFSNGASVAKGFGLESKLIDSRKENPGTSLRLAVSGSPNTLHNSNVGLANGKDCIPLDGTESVMSGEKTLISSQPSNIHSKAGMLKEDKKSSGTAIPKESKSNTEGHIDTTDKHSPTKTGDVSKYVQKKQGESQMVNVRTSTHQVGPCFCSGTNFYHRGEQIIGYGKNVYLDNGNVILADLRQFRTMLGRHVCAFLNSGGGALYFGVDPSDGSVKGLPVSHKYEDALRLDIDRQIKLITPLVSTSAYKVNFAKVMFETGHLMSDMRVLEIEVMPSGYSGSILCPQWPAETEFEEDGREDESSSSWPVAKEGYEFKDVRYIWDDNKVKVAN